MSSDCIYKEFAVKVPAEKVGMDADQYILLSQVGSSNSYDWNGKRTRSWNVSSMGTKEDILATAIYVAGGFESEGLYFGNFGASGSIKPDAYIAKVRRMIGRAQEMHESLTINHGQDALWLKNESGKLLDWDTLTSALHQHQANDRPRWPKSIKVA